MTARRQQPLDNLIGGLPREAHRKLRAVHFSTHYRGQRRRLDPLPRWPLMSGTPVLYGAVPGESRFLRISRAALHSSR